MIDRDSGTDSSGERCPQDAAEEFEHIEQYDLMIRDVMRRSVSCCVVWLFSKDGWQIQTRCC